MDELTEGQEVAVFDYFEGSRTHLAPSFSEWLQAASNTARQQYSDDEWAEVLVGPQPFTPEEVATIQRRRRFAWRLLGVSKGRRLIFEIANNSDGLIPFITI